MKIRAANGFYLPSCFFMHIESKEKIEDCISTNMQTFVHEYIHFLQDLTFPYNIRYTLTENRKFKYLNLFSQWTGSIDKPFNNWDSDTELTNKQLDFTWGDSQFLNNVMGIKDINISHFITYTGARIFKYQLTLHDGAVYQIGARDFLEYIAHKLENSRWKTNHYEFPYKSIDTIFNHFGFGSVKEEVRVCIAEYCMFNDNPMHRLFNLLTDDFKKAPQHLTDYSTCRDFLLNLEWVAVGTGRDSIFTKSQRRLFALRESLTDKYGERFKSINEWINNVIDYSKKNFSNKFIFSELLIMKDEDFYNFINQCIADIGIPLVFNDNHECANLLPDTYDSNEFLQLYVSYSFMNYSLSHHKYCPLHDYCYVNDKTIMNQSCSDNPIGRAREKMLCPMGQFVKRYGFHEVQWNNT